MPRFAAIEGLRAWLAWLVVVTHALQLAGVTDASGSGAGNLALRVLLSGDTAVAVFVIVSGFVIAHLLLVRDEPYGDYLLRRGFRLVPVYLACLAAMLLLRPLCLEAFTGPDWVAQVAMRRDRALAEAGALPLHLGLHLTLLHGVLPDSLLPYSASAILPPAWSLSLEWQFYLVAPLLVGLLRRRAAVACAAAALMLAGFLLLDGGLAGRWRYPSALPLGLPCFLVGMCCRLLLERGPSRPPRWPWVAAIALALPMIDWKAVAIWAAFCPVLLAEAGVLPAFRGGLGRLARLAVLGALPRRLGRWSCSTYLVHFPVFALVVGGGRRLAPDLLGGEGAGAALIGLAVLLTLPASALLHRLVEAPGFSPRGRRGRRTLPARRPGARQATVAAGRRDCFAGRRRGHNFS